MLVMLIITRFEKLLFQQEQLRRLQEAPLQAQQTQPAQQQDLMVHVE